MRKHPAASALRGRGEHTADAGLYSPTHRSMCRSPERPVAAARSPGPKQSPPIRCRHAARRGSDSVDCASSVDTDASVGMHGPVGVQTSPVRLPLFVAGPAVPRADEACAVRAVVDTIQRVAPGVKLRASPGIIPAHALCILYAIFEQLRLHVNEVQSGTAAPSIRMRRHPTYCVVAATPSEAAANHADIESLRRATACEWPVWMEVSSELLGYGIFGTRDPRDARPDAIFHP